MFQFPGLPPPPLCVHGGVARLATVRGSPIRRSSAPSPRAAPRGISLLRHVLLRHGRPRHPPDALRHGHTGAGSPPSPPARDPTRLLAASILSRAPADAQRAGSARHALLLVSAPRLVRCCAAVPDCCLTPARQQAITTSKESGGDEETRTPDPLRAKEVLSQLSYIPEERIGGRFWIRTRDLTLIRGVL